MRNQSNQKKKKSTMPQNLEEEFNFDVLGGFVEMLPELNASSIGMMIEMLGEKGVCVVNFNWNAVFRFLHHVKYDHYKTK